MTDRGLWVNRLGLAGNVRRLMYQSLIWVLVPRNDAGGMVAPIDPEDLQRLTDALVDGMRGNLELGRDLLGGEQLVDEEQAIKLGLSKFPDTLGHNVRRAGTMSPTGRTVRSA
ncbi:MAG TPA: hypothetical protein VHQ48_16185 [Bradyrhizobium sp.]|nr:hypothetical protein [Bradyrhizobium sp.]